MENGKIMDIAITASSFYGNYLKPEFARLNTNRGYCSWTPRGYHDQWMQIDLGKTTSVTGVATQGRCAWPQWVTSYRLSYSTDGQSWTVYYDSGNEKVCDY